MRSNLDPDHDNACVLVLLALLAADTFKSASVQPAAQDCGINGSQTCVCSIKHSDNVLVMLHQS